MSRPEDACRRVAVLADVHGNAVALAAVLDEVRREEIDLLVHCGDLTWGPQPLETLALLDSLDVPILCVRGNADRALVELTAGGSALPTAREAWLVEQHRAEAHDRLATFPEHVEVDVAGLGRVLFCHGSPRSDEECITVATPLDRLGEALFDVEADVVVTAHTHMQFEREARGRRLLNPGSVGMPYEVERGAFWALLGPGVEHRRTEYDLDEAVAGYRASADPLAEQMVETLLEPPTPAEVVEHAERLVFSG